MAAVALSAAIIPDKLEEWKIWSRELDQDPRHSEFAAFIKDSGVSRVRCWLQEGFGDPVGIILYQGDNPAGFFQKMSSSDEPFAVWFREQALSCNGIDMTQSMGEPPELVTDVSAG